MSELPTTDRVACNCAGTAPTMPTYRTKHLVTCPVWVVENIHNVIGRVTEPITVSADQVNTVRVVRAGAVVPEICMHNVKLGQGCFCPHCPTAFYDNDRAVKSWPEIIPWARLKKQAEKGGVEIEAYIESMNAHIENQRREIVRLQEPSHDLDIFDQHPFGTLFQKRDGQVIAMTPDGVSKTIYDKNTVAKAEGRS